MNLVPIVAWSLPKVSMNSLGLATTSSYFAKGGGYGWYCNGGACLMGNGVCLAVEEDAAIDVFPILPPLSFTAHQKC